MLYQQTSLYDIDGNHVLPDGKFADLDIIRTDHSLAVLRNGALNPPVADGKTNSYGISLDWQTGEALLLRTARYVEGPCINSTSLGSVNQMAMMDLVSCIPPAFFAVEFPGLLHRSSGLEMHWLLPEYWDYVQTYIPAGCYDDAPARDYFERALRPAVDGLNAAIVSCRYQGYPGDFYRRLPLLLDDDDSRDTIPLTDLPVRYENLAGYLRRSGLPEAESVRDVLSDRPELLCYAPQIAWLPFQRAESFLALLDSPKALHVLDGIYFLISCPDICGKAQSLGADFISMLCEDRGEARTVELLEEIGCWAGVGSLFYREAVELIRRDGISLSGSVEDIHDRVEERRAEEAESSDSESGEKDSIPSR